MTRERCDVLIVGAGYSGSLAAMLLQRSGLSAVLIERGSHPRFSIGESSTPAADLLLRRLGERYNLPELVGLSSYGRWRKTCPQLTCGPKRGFSYFVHELDAPFVATPEHDTELLVAASVDEPSADVHWLRQDVDAFLVRTAIRTGVTYRDRTAIVNATQHGDRWLVDVETDAGEAVRFDASLVLDASGRAGHLPHTSVARTARPRCRRTPEPSSHTSQTYPPGRRS